jgi:DNA polymerase I-like protein with 3'-5' exonuclease and polymerase domains
MKRISYRIKNHPICINVVEHPEDLEEFADFVMSNPRLAFDTETTGLQIFSEGFRVRLAQFGNTHEAYEIPVEKGAEYAYCVRRALEIIPELTCHNATFDLLVADRHLGVPLEVTYPKTRDTRISAHLYDPRARMEGGMGHSLEDITAKLIDPVVAEEVKGSMRALAQELKTTKQKVFETVSLDHPAYQLYSGMDPILTAIAEVQLSKRVPDVSKDLIGFEHELAYVCAYMERTGFLLDVEYTEKLKERYLYEQELWESVALSHGVEKVNSTDQVAEVLLHQGVKLGKTDKGNWRVDKNVLQPLADAGNELAIAVMKAKQAGKWRKTWVEKFLDMRDANDRCHASINALQARTARMSIQGIPAQTFPSGEATIRHCFIAEVDHVIASIDYQAQELRVMAAISNDPIMKAAFENGDDLHWITAESVFGSATTKYERDKIGKPTNFGKAYGAGPKTLAEKMPYDVAVKVSKAFDETYKGVTAHGKSLQATAKRLGYIVTPTGRRLPVDRARAYASLNYETQSTARDITARGLIECKSRGLLPYLRLPIHDEAVASVPRDSAHEIARAIGDAMRVPDFYGVDIATDAEVGNRSWGSLYE